MNILTSDFECTTHSKGSPFDQRNKPVCIATKWNDDVTGVTFDCYHDWQIEADLFVFFNAKFDLHYWRKCGQQIAGWKIWCCQVAEFVLSGQTIQYPSLEDTAQKYGLGHKLDVVKLDYWDKGIQTDQIPREILSQYAKQDVDLTYQIYLLQLEQFADKPLLFKLFKLMMQDLLVLEEMEWNGIYYNEELCLERSKEIETKLAKLRSELATIYPDIPINFGSGDQLSAFLYGGTIKQEVKIHDGFYGPKAQKAGQPKYKTVVKEHQLPRLVEPLPKSELAKEGYYQTNEPTLRKLKGPAAKKFVGPLLELAKLEKLNSTYYEGLVAKNKEQHWPEGIIHGQFNQVVAATGRLSSSNPNLQNFAGDCQDIFISRY
jgi:DNA polymerase I-like protein with 3'-5' exonuclease and polymerase domains